MLVGDIIRPLIKMSEQGQSLDADGQLAQAHIADHVDHRTDGAGYLVRIIGYIHRSDPTKVPGSLWTWLPRIRRMRMAKRAQLLMCSRSWTCKTPGDRVCEQETGRSR